MLKPFFFSPSGWSGKGCQTEIKSDSQIECVCNHLTHFAVLMDYSNNSDSVPVSFNSVQVSFTLNSWIMSFYARQKNVLNLSCCIFFFFNFRAKMTKS